MELLVYILATWRIASLIMQERGPWDVFGRLRDLCGVGYDDVGQAYATNELARMMLCTWCSSFWIGLGWLLIKLALPGYALYLAFAFALSAGAALISEAIEWLEQTRQR